MQVLLGGRLDLGNTSIALNTRSQSHSLALVMLAGAGILLPYLLEQGFREKSVTAQTDRMGPSIRAPRSSGQHDQETTFTLSFRSLAGRLLQFYTWSCTSVSLTLICLSVSIYWGPVVDGPGMFGMFPDNSVFLLKNVPWISPSLHFIEEAKAHSDSVTCPRSRR